MHYQETLPDPRLRRWVKLYWQIEINRAPAPGLPVPVVPDGSSELIVILARTGPFEADRYVYGQLTGPLNLTFPKGMKVFGVKFQPWGAAAFFRMPMIELSARPTPLADLNLDLENNLQCYFYKPRIFSLNVERMNQILGKFLFAKEPSQSLEIFSEYMHNALTGSWTSRTWLDQGPWTRRTLERRFGELVGLSPLMFHAIERFRRCRNNIGNEASTATELALDFGYYDLSHLDKDARRFTGQTSSCFLGGERTASPFA